MGTAAHTYNLRQEDSLAQEFQTSQQLNTKQDDDNKSRSTVNKELRQILLQMIFQISFIDFVGFYSSMQTFLHFAAAAVVVEVGAYSCRAG